MVSQPPHTAAGSVAGSDTSSRVTELEAEIAQLRDALARRQQIGVATGLLAERFGISPDRAWSLMVRLSQNGHVKVREIAQAVVDARVPRTAARVAVARAAAPGSARMVMVSASKGTRCGFTTFSTTGRASSRPRSSWWPAGDR